MQEYETTGHIIVGHPRKCWENLSCALTPGLDNNVGKISSHKQNTIYIYIMSVCS